MRRAGRRAATRRASDTRTPKGGRTSTTGSSRQDFSRSISRATSTCRCTTPSSRPSTIAASGATRESIPLLTQSTPDVRQRPTGAAALIGGTGSVGVPIDAKVIIAQTSIYVPGNDRSLGQRIVRFLATQDYIGGLFVNDRLGQSARRAPHERCRPHGRRHDAEADDRRQFQELSTGSEESAHERHHHRRRRDSTDRAITDRSRAPTRSTTWRPSAPISRRGSSATRR